MKYKEIEKLSATERSKKLKELKLELVKSKVNVSKTGSAKVKGIKKIIARIHTSNSSGKLGETNK